MNYKTSLAKKFVIPIFPAFEEDPPLVNNYQISSDYIYFSDEDNDEISIYTNPYIIFEIFDESKIYDYTNFSYSIFDNNGEEISTTYDDSELIKIAENEYFDTYLLRR